MFLLFRENEKKHLYRPFMAARSYMAVQIAIQTRHLAAWAAFAAAFPMLFSSNKIKRLFTEAWLQNIQLNTLNKSCMALSMFPL